LGSAGHEPETLETDAVVHLTQEDGGFVIPKIELSVRGKVPGIDQDEFAEHAQTAKDVCPLSKALASVDDITLDAKLEE
jgi:osmotically inducible protein OsmC